MGDAEYYAAVHSCLEAARNGRFCAGAEDAAAAIKELSLKLDAIRKVLTDMDPYEPYEAAGTIADIRRILEPPK